MLSLTLEAATVWNVMSQTALFVSSLERVKTSQSIRSMSLT